MRKLVFLICIFFGVILVGCSGGSYTIVVHPDGSVSEVYAIPLEKEYFLNAGANLNEFNSLIVEAENLLQNIANIEKNEFAKKLLADLASKTITAQKKEDYEGSFKVDIAKDNGVLYLVYSFMGTEVRDYYYGVLNDESANPEIRENFFTYDIVSSGKTKFAVQISSDMPGVLLGEYIYQKFEEQVVKNMGREVFNRLETFPLTFSYASTSHRLHSDADEVVYADGYFIHIWEIDRGSIDRNIEMYLTEARRGNWYLLAFVFGVVTVGIISAIFLILDKMHKKPKK